MDYKEVSNEPSYEVVWPLGKSISSSVELAPALTDLELTGKTVGEFWGWVYRGDQIFPLINEQLQKRYPGIKIVDYNTTGSSHGNNITEKEYLAGITDVFKKYKFDLVIVGVGA